MPEEHCNGNTLKMSPLSMQATTPTTTRMGLVTGPVAQYTLNNKVITTQGNKVTCESPLSMPRKEDLTKAVQLGVMRGLSQNKKDRKSRTTAAASPDKTYMQLKMRNDGVVPFQNAAQKLVSSDIASEFVKPLYLTGMNNFQTGPLPSRQTNHRDSIINKKKKKNTIEAADPALEDNQTPSNQAATSDLMNPGTLNVSNENNNIPQNVSQMGSQTSTDKFVEGGTKDTQTHHSINETFELTNMIGTASIEVPIEIGTETRVRNNDSIDARPTTQRHERVRQVGSQKPHSKLEEANSSIDQPSFQTEHEATFLWNNARINQNSLSNNSRLNYGARSPTDNRKSHDRNSFQLESMMGQKPSHNMSLDSPRKHGKIGRVVENHQQNHPHTHRGDRIHSLHAEKDNLPDRNQAEEQVIINDSTIIPEIKLCGRISQQQGERFENDTSLKNKVMLIPDKKQRVTPSHRRPTDMVQVSASVHTENTKQSSKRQISARESIQERLKQASKNLPSQIPDSIGPLQGHSMNLQQQQSVRGSRGGAGPSVVQQSISPQMTNNSVEQDSPTIHEYGAMMLAQATNRSIESSGKSNNQPLTPQRMMISVDDFQQKQPTTPLSQQRLSKTETQVGGNLDAIHPQSPTVQKDAATNIRNSAPGSTSQTQTVRMPSTIHASERQNVYNNGSSQLVVQGHATESEGGVKIGRMNKNPSRGPTILDSEPQTAHKELSPSPQIESDTGKMMPVIACEITATDVKTSSHGENFKIVKVSAGNQEKDSQRSLINQETKLLASAAQYAEAGGEAKTNKKDPKANEKGGSPQTIPKSQFTDNKPIPTTNLILKNEEAAQKTASIIARQAKVAAAASQTSYPAFELQSYGIRTMKSTESPNSAAGSPGQKNLDGSFFGEDNLTNMALQSQIGTLALTFPNSQQTSHFRKVIPPHDQHLNEGRPMLYRKQKNTTMQIKPSICNVKPHDLDKNTIRNMNAIGVNFAIDNTNRMKPFESRAAKKRKWRDYSEGEGSSMIKEKEITLIKNEEVQDYDGSSSNAEKLKILQRRLTAWPTYEQASGFGSEPTKVVGTTKLSNTIDQISFKNGTEFLDSKPGTRGTDQTLDTLPVEVRQIQTPGGVKSAAGCSRVVARIHLKRLIEQSQANTNQSHQGQPILLDPSIRDRALQTQGCQRTTNRIEEKDSKINKADCTENDQTNTSYKTGGRSHQNRQNSMVSTSQNNNTKNDTERLSQNTQKGLDNRAYRSKTLKARKSEEEGLHEEETPSILNRARMQSFSLEVRRRTDQQSNYLSRTMANWKSPPIGVEDQTSTNDNLDKPQRSIDITESFTNSKLKVRARMNHNITGPLKDNSSIMNDLITDSIRASQYSIHYQQQQQHSDEQLTTLRKQSHIGHPGHVLNFETQKFDMVPKTACVTTRMKGFCCRVPDLTEVRLPYQNSLTQRPGLSPKTPVLRHGVFGPTQAPSVQSKQVGSNGKSEKDRPKLKQFIRPMIADAAKCQIALHENLNNALKKNSKMIPKIIIAEDEGIRNRVNRADLRQIRGYKKIRDRVQSLHIPKLLYQFQTIQPPKTSLAPQRNTNTDFNDPLHHPTMQFPGAIPTGHYPQYDPQHLQMDSSLPGDPNNDIRRQGQFQLQDALNDPDRVNAYAVLYFKRDQMPGNLNGRKLHTSQLQMTPDMHLDIMLPHK